MFITDMDSVGNRLVVGPESDLYLSMCYVNNVTFTSVRPPSASFEAEVKIRYRSPPAHALLEPWNGGIVVRFSRPQRAITPGQAAVFYRDDEVLGGGTIQTVPADGAA